MWTVTVHTSDTGEAIRCDFRVRKAASHARALEVAILLAADDAATHAQILAFNPQLPSDARASHEHKRDALLGLVKTLQIELQKPARRRWNNLPDCQRFSFEHTRLAFACFERA